MLTKRTYFISVISALLACVASTAPATANVLDAPTKQFRHTIHVTLAHMAEARQARARRQRRMLYASLPAGVSISTLESIASCESGGDPTAISSDGTYRGKYQFDFGTWESVGGSGDPAAATEAEQDYRAALLYERSGSSPWPICG